MTSEVENIINGQFEVKADLKQIAVSSTNLTANEQGIAPLEKQGAFTQAQEQAQVQVQTPELTQAQVEPNIAGEPSVVPEMAQTQAEVVQPVSQESSQVPPIENKEDNLEKIDYGNQGNSEILTAPPVEVAATTGLDQMNISEFVDKSLESLGEIPTEEPAQQEVVKMEMPTIETEVKAQEPVGPDARLFEGTQAPSTVSEPDQAQSVGDTPFTVPTFDIASGDIAQEAPTLAEDVIPKLDEVEPKPEDDAQLAKEAELPVDPKIIDDFQFPTFDEIKPEGEVVSEPEKVDETPTAEPIELGDSSDFKSVNQEVLNEILDKIKDISSDVKTINNRVENIDNNMGKLINPAELSTTETILEEPIIPVPLDETPTSIEPTSLETVDPTLVQPTIEAPILQEPAAPAEGLPSVDPSLTGLTENQLDIDEEPVHGTFI